MKKRNDFNVTCCGIFIIRYRSVWKRPSMNSFLSARRKCDGRGFHARRSSIDGCALLKGRTSDGNWTSKGHWMLSPAQVQVTTTTKKSSAYALWKKYQMERKTQATPRVRAFHFSHSFSCIRPLPFLSPIPRPSHPVPSRLYGGLIVTGLGSFAAAVGSTRWVTVTPSSSPRMEQRKARQLVAFTSNLRKNARKSRELALPKCGWGVYSELWVVDPPETRLVTYLRWIPEVILFKPIKPSFTVSTDK